MSIKPKSNPKPKIACEISADRVLAGKIADSGGVVEMCSVRELPPGSVVPDLTEPNILQPELVRKAINDALAGVSGRLRDIIGVLPDAAVRVVLLDFDTLPSDPQDAESVVRFRLKKSLPFDVEKAKVSYHVQQSLGGLRLVAAVALNIFCSAFTCVPIFLMGRRVGGLTVAASAAGALPATTFVFEQPEATRRTRKNAASNPHSAPKTYFDFDLANTV